MYYSQQPISLSKKLIHIDSFYKRDGETSTQFTYRNNDVALSKVRAVSLKSCSFLNSFTNIYDGNNVLQLLTDDGPTYTLKEGSRYFGTPVVLNQQAYPSSSTNLPCSFRVVTGTTPNTNLLIFQVNPLDAVFYYPSDGSYQRDLQTAYIGGCSIMINNPETDLEAVQLTRDTTATHEYTYVTSVPTSTNFDCYVTLNIRFTDTEQVFQYDNIFSVPYDESPYFDYISTGFNQSIKWSISPVKNRSIIYGWYLIGGVTESDTLNFASLAEPNVVWNIASNNPGICYSNKTSIDVNHTDLAIVTNQGNWNDSSLIVDVSEYIHQNEQETKFCELPAENQDITTVMGRIKFILQAKYDIYISPHPSNDGGLWIAPDNKVRFTSNVPIRIFPRNPINGSYNDMSWVLGFREDTGYVTDVHAQAIPDLSGIDHIMIHSKTLTNGKQACLGNQQSSNIIACIPVESSFGAYNFYQSTYENQWCRSYQLPNNCTIIDISIRDTTGKLLNIHSDVSMLMEITYEN